MTLLVYGEKRIRFVIAKEKIKLADYYLAPVQPSTGDIAPLRISNGAFKDKFSKFQIQMMLKTQ